LEREQSKRWVRMGGEVKKKKTSAVRGMEGDNGRPRLRDRKKKPVVILRSKSRHRRVTQSFLNIAKHRIRESGLVRGKGAQPHTGRIAVEQIFLWMQLPML